MSIGAKSTRAMDESTLTTMTPIRPASANKDLIEQHARDTQEIAELLIKYERLKAIAQEIYAARGIIYQEPGSMHRLLLVLGRVLLRNEEPIC